MSCIAKGNVRCTRCCEALHINKSQYLGIVKGRLSCPQQEVIFGSNAIWEPISKRRAKKINPYLFSRDKYNSLQDPEEGKRDMSRMQYFRCRALDSQLGCTIRDQGIHPETCKIYQGNLDYSPTCLTDINIIARSA